MIGDSEMPLPATIPIFPLPNVVLFPNVFLPLHIFEPRYRAMVKDALASDRIIGMVLLRPGYESNYAGRPPVYPIGCAGLITHSEPLPDGRFNIVLRGLEKFRMTGEEDGQPYRLAQVEALAEMVTDDDKTQMHQHRRRLERLLAAAMERGTDSKLSPNVPDDDLVNALAQYLALEPIERQALLECNGVLSRCGALIELLEMRSMMAPRTGSWTSGLAH
jgi:Lon protease-like protein